MTLNQTFRQEELHVFIVDEKNAMESVNTFEELYSLRNRKRREFWLVEVSALTDIRSYLKDVSLDLDDDLYLFSGTVIF